MPQERHSEVVLGSEQGCEVAKERGTLGGAEHPWGAPHTVGGVVMIGAAGASRSQRAHHKQEEKLLPPLTFLHCPLLTELHTVGSAPSRVVIAEHASKGECGAGRPHAASPAHTFREVFEGLSERGRGGSFSPCLGASSDGLCSLHSCRGHPSPLPRTRPKAFDLCGNKLRGAVRSQFGRTAGTSCGGSGRKQPGARGFERCGLAAAPLKPLSGYLQPGRPGLGPHLSPSTKMYGDAGVSPVGPPACVHYTLSRLWHGFLLLLSLLSLRASRFIGSPYLVDGYFKRDLRGHLSRHHVRDEAQQGGVDFPRSFSSRQDSDWNLGLLRASHCLQGACVA